MRKKDLKLIKLGNRIGQIFAEDMDCFLGTRPDVKLVEHSYEHGGLYGIHFLDNDKVEYIFKDKKGLKIIPSNSKEYKDIMVKYFGAWEVEFEDEIYEVIDKGRKLGLSWKFNEEELIGQYIGSGKVKIQCRKGKIVIEKVKE